MSNPTIRIHNLETDEIIDRQMNDDELSEYEIDKAKTLAEAKTKAETKLSKVALLERLGITEEEAKLLLS